MLIGDENDLSLVRSTFFLGVCVCVCVCVCVLVPALFKSAKSQEKCIFVLNLQFLKHWEELFESLVEMCSFDTSGFQFSRKDCISLSVGARLNKSTGFRGSLDTQLLRLQAQRYKFSHMKAEPSETFSCFDFFQSKRPSLLFTIRMGKHNRGTQQKKKCGAERAD